MRPIATIVLALAAAVALTACSAGPAHPLRTLEPSSVTRAEIRDGTTGELRTITDEDGLHRLTELLGGLAMTRSEDQGARVGYVFSVTLYAGDEVVEQALINPATAVVERVYYDLDTDPTPALRDLFEAAAGGPTAGTPLRGDAPVGTTTDAGEPSDLVERAIDDLAQRLGVGRQEIAVERFEPREFTDSSLGAPEPDTVYTPATTPGYVIELLGGGDVWTYHAAEGRAVLVPSPGPDAPTVLEPAPGGAPDAAELETLAIADLAERLGVEADVIRVEAVEPREFPDTSLGVPEPDTMYAPVVVPGYAITLGVGDETFVYHAGDGRVVAVPEGPGGAPPSAPEDGV